MARKTKGMVAKNAKELASQMGLSPAHALEWETRYSLTNKIVETIKKNGLTVTQVARRAETSRARITHILKGDSHGISIDVLLRVLAAAGQTIKITYKKAA